MARAHKKKLSADPVGIGIFGMSHKTASLQIREQCILRFAGYRYLKKIFNPLFREMALLSTCNRIEVYFIFNKKRHSPETITRLVSARVRARASSVQKHNLYFRFGKKALRHLYSVASGLDSLIAGETEIAQQVGKARRGAAEHKTGGPILHAIFSRVENFSSHAREISPLYRNPTSISHEALAAIKAEIPDMTQKAFLVYGAGIIAQRTASLIAREAPQKLLVYNRTARKAHELKKKLLSEHKNLPVRVIQKKELTKSIAASDCVVTAAASPRYIIKKGSLSRSFSNTLFMDLGIPRNIDPALENPKKGIKILNIDHFKKRSRKLYEERKKYIKDMKNKIRQSADLAWMKILQFENSPYLKELSKYSAAFLEKNIKKTLAKNPHLAGDADTLRILAASVSNKLLHGFYETINSEKSATRRKTMAEAFLGSHRTS